MTAFLVLAAFSSYVSLLSPSIAGGDPTAARSCLPVSVRTTSGTFTYAVRIEAGHVRCGPARSAIRDAANWPPGDAPGGRWRWRWRCEVGQQPGSWAISCIHRGAVVRGYGPVREQDPWVIAAVRVPPPVLAPTYPAGLTLREVSVRRCDGSHRWIRAEYVRSDGASLTIAEGRRYACGDLGDSPRLAVWRIHGQPATLLEFCGPTGCSRLWGDYALRWQERGAEIILITHGLGQRELLAIARSMAVVPV